MSSSSCAYERDSEGREEEEEDDDDEEEEDEEAEAEVEFSMTWARKIVQENVHERLFRSFFCFSDNYDNSE